MKFIHAGDLHLGNPFMGLTQVPAWLKGTLQQATETALQRLVDDAIAEMVDFVLLPGDLFDTTTPDARAQLTLRQAFETLQSAGIPVYLGFGNHDFVANWQNLPTWPENVTVFPAETTTVTLVTKAQERVAITGFSYTQRHINDNRARLYPVKQANVDYHIGLYHGALGEDGQGDYAPFTLSDMQVKHYDYWALGHIHVRQTLQDKPFIGYSGSIQGLNKNESGPKGYYLVTSEQGELVPTFTPVAPVIWQTARVQLASDAPMAIQHIRQTLQNDDDFQLVELSVTSEDSALLSLIMNNQLLAQLIAASTPTDNFFVYNIKLVAANEEVSLPAVDQQYWSQTADDVFNYDMLQQLGLKQVQDAAVLQAFLTPAMLAELKQAVIEKLRLTEMGVATDED